MGSRKSNLLSSTMLHMVVGAGIAAGGAIALSAITFARAGPEPVANPPAVAKANPAAVRVAACTAKKACNPCAA